MDETPAPPAMPRSQTPGDAAPPGGAATMLNDDIIKQYLEGAIESSKRSRHIAILTVAASLLVFMAVWKALPFSWGNIYLTKMNAMHLNWPLRDQDFEAHGLNEDQALHIRQCASMMFGKPAVAFKDDSISSEELDRFKKRLDRLVDEEARRLNDQTMNVKVPIVDAQLSINDVPLFSGIALSALLSIFWFSLHREAENISRLSQAAQQCPMSDNIREIIGMHQVLFIPTGASGATKKITEFILDLILLLPLLVYLFVVWWSRTQLPEWRTLDARMGNISISLHIIFLIIIAYLVWQCRICDARVAVTWNTWRNAPTPGGASSKGI